MSLRALLNSIITAFFFLLLVVGVALVIGNARQAVIEELDSSVTLAERLLQGMDESRLPRPGLGLRLQTLEAIRHLCISLRDDSGVVVWRSEDCDPGKRSRAPTWFASLLAAPERRYERRLPSGDVLLVRSEAADEVDEVWQDAKWLIGLIVMLAILANAVFYVLVGWAMRPLRALETGLDRVAAGNYTDRLSPFPQPEFARISAHFNDMVSMLGKRSQQVAHLRRRTVTIQEEERRALARELHDELGQALAAIRADAASIERQADAVPATVRSSAGAIREVAARVYGVVKSMMKRLRPGSLDELGLASALHDMVDDWRARHRLRCELQIDGRIPEHDESVNIHVFRIVQEALTNVDRHAQASRVSIGVHCGEAGVLTISIRDDGRGFDPEDSTDGFGLLGMRERAAMLNGQFHLTTAVGQGTQITVTIPVAVAH